MPWLLIWTSVPFHQGIENLKKFGAGKEVLNTRKVLIAILIVLCQIPKLMFIL